MIHSGSFKKGHKINIGRKCSKETRRKIGEATEGHPQYNTGRTHFKKGIANNILEKNPMWKGGRCETKPGYVLIKKHNHPFKNCQNYVLEHRLVMEKHLGRYLKPEEVVHHINNIPSDNRIINLQLFHNGASHISHHERLKRI